MIEIRLVLFTFAVTPIVECPTHDISTPEKALIGHWQTESGNTDYYFDVSKLVMIDYGTRMDQTYTVLESNNHDSWIKIRVTTEYRLGHDKILVFATNRKSLTATIATADIYDKWNFIDCKKEP
jgi:hypothetical protein